MIWTLLTSLTPLSRVILEKLTGSQFKKFPAFYAFTIIDTVITRHAWG